MERARDYYASLPDIIRSSIPTSITKQLTTGAPTDKISAIGANGEINYRQFINECFDRKIQNENIVGQNMTKIGSRSAFSWKDRLETRERLNTDENAFDFEPRELKIGISKYKGLLEVGLNKGYPSNMSLNSETEEYINNYLRNLKYTDFPRSIPLQNNRDITSEQNKDHHQIRSNSYKNQNKSETMCEEYLTKITKNQKKHNITEMKESETKVDNGELDQQQSDKNIQKKKKNETKTKPDKISEENIIKEMHKVSDNKVLKRRLITYEKYEKEKKDNIEDKVNNAIKKTLTSNKGNANIDKNGDVIKIGLTYDKDAKKRDANIDKNVNKQKKVHTNINLEYDKSKNDQKPKQTLPIMKRKKSSDTGNESAQKKAKNGSSSSTM